MVDQDVVLKRIGRIRECVAALESIRRTRSRKQFLEDELIQAAAERKMQVAIQAVLDISNHIVADMRLDVPDEERNAFEILASNQVIPRNLSKTLNRMAGVRNVLVHEYLDVDVDRIYEILSKRLGDFEKFIKVVSKLL